MAFSESNIECYIPYVKRNFCMINLNTAQSPDIFGSRF